jgi:AcrR family transcriptional regulator
MVNAGTGTTDRPRGREAVQAALLEAAARLFVQQGPAAVSVRQIAAEAGVNHGLVHQYFGSKEGLVRATLEHLADELAPVAEAAPDVPASIQPLLAAISDRAAFVRLLGWLLLEGAAPSALPTDFPVIRGTLDRVRSELGDAEPRVDPRIVVATFISVAFGWLVFRRYITEAAQLEDHTESEILAEMGKLVGAMVDWNRSEG